MLSNQELVARQLKELQEEAERTAANKVNSTLREIINQQKIMSQAVAKIAELKKQLNEIQIEEVSVSL